jgi:hypothetical protein
VLGAKGAIMGKPVYGEFTFSKSADRPKVKGYAFGGQPQPMAAKAPMPAKPPVPARPAVQTKPSSPVPTKPVGGMTIDEIKHAKATNQTIDPKNYDAMARATENAKIRQQAMDARARAEAEANRLPAKNSATVNRLMERSSTIKTPRDAMNFGKPVTRAKGGDVKAATKKELSLLSKAKAPKAVMVHEKAEMKGKVGDTKPMVKKELSILRKADAPLSVIKEEKKEMSSPLMANKGGKVGLWDNIHAKRERIKEGSGERMRKPGSKGAPTAQDLKNSAKKMEEGGKADMAQDKAMIKKAIKQHDQQEHAGGKGTVLKLKKGGVPAYNKTPKIC